MRHRLPVLALLLLVALALRGWDFGNPVIHVDEQYYLLVGDRLAHGARVYLDIWDRKPIGLFLLYAGFARVGDGILAYQLGATLSATLTAAAIMAGGRRLGATPRGALLAAIAYLLWLPLLGGRGGQAPVFYNLPMALAALLTLRLPRLVAAERRATIAGQGALACLLAGVALQLKGSALFEGVFFGMAHLVAMRRSGTGWAGTALLGSGLALSGAALTLAAGGFYGAQGGAAWHIWWFANVDSIFLRPPYPLAQSLGRLAGIGATLSPLILAAALGLAGRLRGPRRDEAWLALGWGIAALIGFAAIGTFFDHYALPLLVPLCVAAAPTLGAKPRVRVGALGLGLLLFAVERAVIPDDAPGARAVARAVAANSRGACPYVFIGDTITYHLARSCLPTRYVFPNFLAYTTERGATGIDAGAEVRRILARRPPVIVTTDRRLAIWNPASLAALKPVLARDYRVILTVPRARWHSVVYLRRNLSARP
jgi:hypothetical protein